VSIKSIRNSIILLATAVGGALFGPSLLEKRQRHVDPIKIQMEIEGRLDVIRQYMDQKYGEGFFDEQVMRHSSKRQVLELTKGQENGNG